MLCIVRSVGCVYFVSDFVHSRLYLWGIGQSRWYGTNMCAVEQVWILCIDYLHYGASLCTVGSLGCTGNFCRF